MPLTTEQLKLIEDFCKEGLIRRERTDLADVLAVEAELDAGAKITAGEVSVVVHVQPDEAKHFQRYPNTNAAKPGVESLCRWRGEQGAVALLHAVSVADTVNPS